MEAKFEQFLKERRYLKNVSPRTIEWYEQSFHLLQNPNPTQADITNLVVRMRDAGLTATSCNARLRAISAYLRWSGSLVRCQRLKEPTRVLQMFKPEDIAKLVKWKPKTPFLQRVHLLSLMLVDTGCRISELLSLTWDNVDFDNCLVTVVGKGDKQRIVPFAIELRRFLFKYQKESKYRLVFASSVGTAMQIRNVHRAVTNICTLLDITIPTRKLHAFRHTFATTFIRRGGSVFHLQQALGHTSLTMSQRYTHLGVADLQAIHQKTSLLSR
jgi:integrase/recombinase XerD